MKRLSLALILMICAAFSCGRHDIDNRISKCVENKIKDFNTSSTCKDARVRTYTFQGNTVYTFEPGSCGADMTTEVLDSACNSLGTLGGIIGNTKINGEDFSNATFLKTIWQK